MIEWAEECLHDADLMPLRPSGDPRNFHSDSLHERDDFDDARFERTGWLFCVPKNRFVQLNPACVCIDNAVVRENRCEHDSVFYSGCFVRDIPGRR